MLNRRESTVARNGHLMPSRFNAWALIKLAQSTATASDGGMTVPNTPGAGKKPHQRKRKRAEKSSSKAKKVMLE